MPTDDTRLGMAKPLGADSVDNLRLSITDIINTLGPVAMIGDQGALSLRPVSTPATPGIRDRFYFVRGDPTPANNGVLWRDNGTGWDAVGVLIGTTAGKAAAGDTHAFPGVVSGPTPAAGDDSTKLATTAFVAAGSAATFPTVSKFNRGATTVETVIAQFSLPANSLVAGRAYRIELLTAPPPGEVYRVRVGTAGTVADALVVSNNTSATSTVTHLMAATIVCVTPGSAGTMTGAGYALNGGTDGYRGSNNEPAATVDTTAALFVTVTAQNSGGGAQTTKTATASRVG